MSDRLYSLLLLLYPRAFRERYAVEMARLFRDRMRHENGMRVWIDVLGDALVSVPRQHWRREPHSIYPPSAASLRIAQAAVAQALVVTALLSAGGAFLGLSLVMTALPRGWALTGLIFFAVM